MIGPAADDPRLLQGDYSYPAHTEIVQPRDEQGRLIESAGDFAPGPYYPESVTPLAGIRALAADVTYAKGAGVRGERDRRLRRRGRRTRRAADVAICFVGGRSGLMPDCTSGEFRDVSDLGLPGVQQQLVEAVVATGTPTVVVVVSGRAHALPWIAEHAPAVALRVGARRAGRRRDRRRALRRRVAVGPAPDLVAAQRRSRSGAPRPSRRRRPQPDLRRLRRRARVAAPLLRPRPHVHDVRVRRAAGERRRDAPTRPFTVEVERAQHRDRGQAPRSCSCTSRDEVARVARPDRQLAGFTRVTLEPGEVGDRAVHRRPDPARLLRRGHAARDRARHGACHGRRPRDVVRRCPAPSARSPRTTDCAPTDVMRL